MAKDEEKDETAESEDESEKDESENKDADAGADDADTSEEGEEGDEGKGSKDKESGKDSDQNLDWKKIADDERTKRRKAQDALAEDRYNASKRAREGEEGDEEEIEEDKPLTPKQMKRILAEEREAARKEVLEGRAAEVSAEITESKDEGDAVFEIWQNRRFPEGMKLDDQVREAYYIAHGPRLLAKRDELRRSLKSKDTRAKSGNEDTHRDPPKGNEPKLAPQDRTELLRLGFAWDGKRYSKKLASGKVLVKDWKTKKTFISAK